METLTPSPPLLYNFVMLNGVNPEIINIKITIFYIYFFVIFHDRLEKIGSSTKQHTHKNVYKNKKYIYVSSM